MVYLLLSLLVLLLGAAGAALFGRNRMFWIGPLAAVVGSLLAAGAGLHALLSGTARDFSASWTVPLGTLHMGLDALSSLFVVLIGGIGALAAIYGHGYLGNKGICRVAMSWCWYNLLTAAMLVVVLARDGFLFLVAWEVMSLASFFLVMFDHEEEGVIRAGWIYLVATHIGTAFLLVMFLLLGRGGSLAFEGFSATGSLSSVIFAAAVIGFGTKAGFVPMHIWLPEAHPAAPSHVSALMSGVMIKTGIYGILRVLTFLGEPVVWWGWTLVGIGAVSGLLGVLFALAQHDLKRLLAYHSVENIGIITLGLGIGLLGVTAHNPVMATLGFCGGLLHVLNHGLFKSLLFLGAGSVLYATKTRDLDQLGGLIKRMPVTAASFLVGAAAISGLPPLNGFVSEFFIYAGAFTGLSAGSQVWSGLVVVASLALIGGLAAACFTKASGIVFLGEARSHDALKAHEAPLSMRGPLVLLALLCVVIGLGAPWVVPMVLPAAVHLMPTVVQVEIPALVMEIPYRISLAALGLIVLTTLIAGLRAGLLRGRSIREGGTWDCGYAVPTPRMQYTASSFVSPIAGMFASVLNTRCELQPPEGLFPKESHLYTHTPDLFVKVVYGPVVKGLSRLAAAFRGLQRGQTHLYVLYIVVAILLCLICNLG